MEDDNNNDNNEILMMMMSHRCRRRQRCFAQNKFGKGKAGPVRSFLELLIAFATRGVHVFLVTDGFGRHHSKKSSIQRRAKIEQARHDSLCFCKHILCLVDKSRSSSSYTQ
jgi:hypothetical protein